MTDTGPSYTKSPISLRLTNVEKLKDEIFEKLDIVSVASDLCDMDLDFSGHQHRALCPFHDDSNPSLYLTADKGQGGVYHCFSCKASGDAIELLRHVRHQSFTEAMTTLAEAADVDIKGYIREPTDHERFRDGAQLALDDLISRAEKNYIRRAPSSSVLRVKDPDVASEFRLGVTSKRLTFQNDYKELARHNDSVIFPYFTPEGKPITIKSRPMSGEKRTYGLSNEWPLLQPALFGLHVAKDYTENELIVVEGEWDALALHEVGVRNVVAVGGSRWSPELSEIVRDLRINKLVFWPDGDDAGRIFAESICNHMEWFEGISVRIAWHPEEPRDPEDIVRGADSPAAARRIAAGTVRRSRNDLAWLIDREIDKQKPRTLSDQLEFFEKIRTKYGSRFNGVTEALVLKDLAQQFDIPEADLADFAISARGDLQAPDSERVLLGKCLRDQQYFIRLRKAVDEEDFSFTKHRRVWVTLTEMVREGLEFDPVALKAQASILGVEADFLDELRAEGDANILWHENQVIDLSVRRMAKKNAEIFANKVSDPDISAGEAIGSLTHTLTKSALGRGSGAFQHITDQVDEAVEKLHARVENPGDVIGIDLGSQLPTLNKTLSGIQERRLVLIGATSGRGKSTLSLQICNIASVGYKIPTDVISLEMDSDEILFKQCAHLTGIDSMRIQQGALEKEELDRVLRAMRLIRSSPMRIYTPDSMTPSEFVLYARESTMDRDTKIFVFDYAQMVEPDADFRRESKYEQLGDFAYTAKLQIARALDVCVICPSQLGRAAADKERPTSEDMGDSYHLVRAADVVILLHQDEDGGSNEIWVDKNRQGRGNVLIPITFDKTTSTFYEKRDQKMPEYGVPKES